VFIVKRTLPHALQTAAHEVRPSGAAQPPPAWRREC
jgi:hypothetical protein